MVEFASTASPFVALSNGEGVFLEVPCTFKVARVLTAFSQASAQINLGGILAEAGDVNATVLAARVLPHLLNTAPDLFMHILALCLIPNASLKSLRKEPGGIDKAIEDKIEWLSFETTALDALALANGLLPLLGVDALKNALSQLVETATNALGLKENPSA